MAGYWATAPFLHNGSVPTLYQLLSPVEEREKKFWLGDLEFDPVNVGFSTKKFKGGFEYKTKRSLVGFFVDGVKALFGGRWNFQFAIDGNSNAGHEFRDAPKGTPGVIGPYLTPEERLDIIEYMKVIHDVPALPAEEAKRRRDLLQQMSQYYEGAPEYATAPQEQYASETWTGPGGPEPAPTEAQE